MVSEQLWCGSGQGDAVQVRPAGIGGGNGGKLGGGEPESEAGLEGGQEWGSEVEGW